MPHSQTNGGSSWNNTCLNGCYSEKLSIFHFPFSIFHYLCEMNKKYCIIMAGGVGSRFWPISRRERPKQFLDILGTGKTFLRATYERFAPMVDKVLVVTNSAYVNLVLEQIPELSPEHVLGEPVGRNTAPCVAWAAHMIAQEDPHADMIVTPADHLVLDTEVFRKTLTGALDFVNGKEAMMTIGIEPTGPNTGYGYIQAETGDVISPVKTFTEKPDLELATAFIASGEFLWNAGIFIFNVQTFLGALHEFLPDMAAQFDRLDDSNIEDVYSACRAVSMDIGIMEKAHNVWVYRGDFGWSDVGTWGSLWDNSPHDAQGNAAPESALMSNSTGCIVRVPEGRVAVVEGLHDFIVVESGNVLLICPRAQEQDVKRLVEELKFRGVEGVV
jgi:mannose-1-phosphate guanylyltransferase